MCCRGTLLNWMFCQKKCSAPMPPRTAFLDGLNHRFERINELYKTHLLERETRDEEGSGQGGLSIVRKL